MEFKILSINQNFTGNYTGQARLNGSEVRFRAGNNLAQVCAGSWPEVEIFSIPYQVYKAALDNYNKIL